MRCSKIKIVRPFVFFPVFEALGDAGCLPRYVPGFKVQNPASTIHMQKYVFPTDCTAQKRLSFLTLSLSWGAFLSHHHHYPLLSPSAYPCLQHIPLSNSMQGLNPFKKI